MDNKVFNKDVRTNKSVGNYTNYAPKKKEQNCYYQSGDEMSVNVAKGLKGEVWMVTASCFKSVSGGTETPETIGVLLNQRPVLIMSEDSYNWRKPTRIVLKVGSAHGRNEGLIVDDSYVAITAQDGRKSLIYTDQTETININSLSHHMYTLSDEIMKVVQKEYQKLISSDENEDNLASCQKVIQALKDELEEVKNFKRMALDIEELFSEIQKEKLEIKQDILNLKNNTQEHHFDFDLKDIQDIKYIEPEEENEIIANKIKERGFWTDEKIAEFFKDCDNLSEESLFEKWGVEKNKISSTKSFLRRKLRKKGMVSELGSSSSSEKRKRIMWTDEKIAEFFKDYDSLTKEEIAEKWDIKISSVSKTNQNLKRRCAKKNR